MPGLRRGQRARHQVLQGVGSAAAVLAPAYEWFIDGFETADLGAAKTLLAKLA
jgi:hypothetical protein